MGTELTEPHGVARHHPDVLAHRWTHYINVRNRAATGVPKCMLDINFSLADSVYELAHLEDLLVDDEVLSTWEFQVKGAATGSDGVGISFEKCLQVTQPVPVPRRKAMGGGGGSPKRTVSLLW